MSYQGIAADMEALEDAVEALPQKCLYHGDEVGVVSPPPLHHVHNDPLDGACCASGKPALYRRRAEAALERLRENL